MAARGPVPNARPSRMIDEEEKMRAIDNGADPRGLTATNFCIPSLMLSWWDHLRRQQVPA